MTRQLLDAGASAPPPLPATPASAAPPPLAAQAEPIVEPAQQALAGALPAWDLQPASGFVRRKR